MAKVNYTRAEQAHYEEIRKQERYIRRLQYAEEAAKRSYKLAVEKRVAAQSDLHELILESADQRMLPGMDDMRIEREDIGRSWTETPVSVVIHEKKIVDVLEDYALKVLGDLVNYCRSGRGLTKLDGIGEHEEATIIESLQNYWTANPDLPRDQADGPEKQES